MSKVKDSTESINNIVKELLERYDTTYLAPDACSKMTLLYKNKLNQFKRYELDGVAYELGISADEEQPLMKTQLCEKIVNHYQLRKNMVLSIQNGIRSCSNRIFALTSGPICENHPEVFYKTQCESQGSIWKTDNRPPAGEGNAEWFANLTALQNAYLNGLQQLMGILIKLKNSNTTDNIIKDEELKALAKQTSEIVDSMSELCKNLYRKIRLQEIDTGPNYTEEMKKEIAGGFYDARIAALRAASGLSAHPPSF